MESFQILKEGELLSFSLVLVESPQVLLDRATFWIQRREARECDLEGPFFYCCSYEGVQTFGVSLWAVAYEGCSALWKDRVQKFNKDPFFFPFIMNVRAATGFIFLGLRLGLKYFLFKEDPEVFIKLQHLVRDQGGDLFEDQLGTPSNSN